MKILERVRTTERESRREREQERPKERERDRERERQREREKEREIGRACSRARRSKKRVMSQNTSKVKMWERVSFPFCCGNMLNFLELRSEIGLCS